jgi:hypothetical protein
LTAAGTPAVQRKIEADNRRVQDLQTLARTLSPMPTLPQSLPERPGLRVKDPDTGVPYEYRLKSDKEYELCATFTTSGDAAVQQYTSGFWTHPKGRACFAFDKSRPVPW